MMRRLFLIIFKQGQLAAYYRDADVALVTPMRDGMNLVAKEFVACNGTSIYCLKQFDFRGHLYIFRATFSTFTFL